MHDVPTLLMQLGSVTLVIGLILNFLWVNQDPWGALFPWVWILVLTIYIFGVIAIFLGVGVWIWEAFK